MAKKTKAKLSWKDTTDLVFRLIDEHPTTDAKRLDAKTLISYVTALPDFSDKAKSPGNEALEDLRTQWAEERAEMDEELGPVEAPPEEEALDEDEYRDDKMVDDDEEEDEESEFTSLDDAFGDEDEDDEEENY